MDQAVAAAYSWDDLDRLLHLNHERYAEEVRQGLHEKKQKRGSRKKTTRRKTTKKKADKQMPLL